MHKRGQMIRIECTGADSLPLDAIEEFQGNLKKRSKKDIELIITSIEKYGFSFPFFIWNGTGHNYCLDGHGRIQALSEMRRKGEDLPMFPVVYVEAKDEAEAKNKLLRLNSQYGEMTIESVMEFTDGLDIQFEELKLSDGNELQFITSDIAEIEPPSLSSEDRGKIRTITFTVDVNQLEIVKEAIGKMIDSGQIITDINENKNGNAISRICEGYINEQFS
jgi:hypothetical protein